MIKKVVCLVGIAGNGKDILLSCYTLKSYLVQFKEIRDKFNIVVLDYPVSASSEQIRRDIIKVQADYIGFSCYVWNREKVEYLISCFGWNDIIVGGPDILKSEETGRITFITGEGEAALYRYLLGKGPPIQGLDEMPETVVDYTKVDRMSFETQRGCNWRCAYCNYRKGNNKIRYRNPQMVIKEIKQAWESGIKTGRIVDPNFFSDPTHAVVILRGLIDNGIKMRLFFEVIPSYVNDNLTFHCAEYIQNGGELAIALGIQSLNRASLKAINRPNGGEDTAIKMLTAAGATLRLDSILGLPFETRHSYEQLIGYLCNYLAGSKHYPNPNLLMIINGTPLADKVKEFGLEVTDKYVTATPAMSWWDLNFCMKLNAILYRIYGPNSRVRDNYPTMDLEQLTEILLKINDKLPRMMSEDYYYNYMNNDIPDDLL